MKSRKDSGFSLIEVMITSFILAVGLLGIVALQGIAKKSLADTDKQIEASFLARTALQEMRADTSWLSAPTLAAQDVLIDAIIANSIDFASRSNLDLCRHVAGNVTIAVSWQIQNATITAPAGNDAGCGLVIDNRRQVIFTSLITEAI
ncbi:prepilin-type N-terminal cleavage/methylation domain-containing protein [Moritella sp. 24]|uniref:type IV pilus modification PilV family protein n=1 Tax=Moritella sp. 24 TaxID=2746230 RepID=UPI001BAC9AC4|nr:prepilin-type N-terminal cleavage/methylation domain-containing protein [Moritella sp. 24]QUM75218.1 prepilin-type N-terminal cleavage/methylation domain-containing protein [Moritella sp. 24]